MYMRVKCLKADDTNVLVEDALYTVAAVTRKGNYILSEVAPPQGFNCFDKHRFQILEIWDEQPSLFSFDEEELEMLFG